MSTPTQASSAIAYAACDPVASRREKIIKTCKFITSLILSDLPHPGPASVEAIHDYLSDFSELASALRLIERHFLLHVFTQHSNPDRALDLKATDAESLVLSRLAKIHQGLLDRLEDDRDLHEDSEPESGSDDGHVQDRPASSPTLSPAPSAPPVFPSGPPPPSSGQQATDNTHPAANNPSPNEIDGQPSASTGSISNLESQSSNSLCSKLKTQNSKLSSHDPPLPTHNSHQVAPP